MAANSCLPYAATGAPDTAFGDCHDYTQGEDADRNAFPVRAHDPFSAWRRFLATRQWSTSMSQPIIRAGLNPAARGRA